MDRTLQKSPYTVIDNFLPAALAEAMRQDIDNHFAKPGAHRAERHQIWNYWFVPELYTYLRTQPEKIIAPESVKNFFDILTNWSIAHCGMAKVTWPYLSLYVSGCKQGLHNDSGNGRFGFVYSLTRDTRQTTGGETLIHHAGDHFREKLSHPAAGRSFYDAIAPRFNRLLIFDDRLPHAVERVDGTMDPREGRFVLHGHLSETSWMSSGPLPRDAIAPVLLPPLQHALSQTIVNRESRHGPLVLRVTVNAAGGVTHCGVVTDRVIHAQPDNPAWETWLDTLTGQLKTLRFQPAPGNTDITLPLAFGNKL